MKRLTGSALILGVFAYFMYEVASEDGWAHAFGVFGLALLLATVLIVGIILAVGD